MPETFLMLYFFLIIIPGYKNINIWILINVKNNIFYKYFIKNTMHAILFTYLNSLNLIVQNIHI